DKACWACSTAWLTALALLCTWLDSVWRVSLKSRCWYQTPAASATAISSTTMKAGRRTERVLAAPAGPFLAALAEVAGPVDEVAAGAADCVACVISGFLSVMARL